MDQPSVLKIQPESPEESPRQSKEVEKTEPHANASNGTDYNVDENLILHYMQENTKLVSSILAEKDLSPGHKELCLQQIIHCVKTARDKLRSSNKDQVNNKTVVVRNLQSPLVVLVEVSKTIGSII